MVSRSEDCGIYCNNYLFYISRLIVRYHGIVDYVKYSQAQRETVNVVILKRRRGESSRSGSIESAKKNKKKVTLKLI